MAVDLRLLKLPFLYYVEEEESLKQLEFESRRGNTSRTPSLSTQGASAAPRTVFTGIYDRSSRPSASPDANMKHEM